MTITILGLGPGNPAHLTREAWDILEGAEEVYLRTERHPTAASLPAHLKLHSFDGFYKSATDFAQLYESMAARIVELGRRPGGVLYAVPGHPLVAEESVSRILARASDASLSVIVVAGLSFLEPVLTILGIDAIHGLQLADATELAGGHHPRLDPDQPALIAQLYSRGLASELKLTLLNAYPDEHLVTLVQAAGTAAQTTISVPLCELDHGQHVDHLTTLYVPPLQHVGGVPAFLDTIAKLRAPDGCPWDREQTHQSLRTNLLEEAYEVLAALDADDSEKLSEELGDLLMQIAMHAQIATEGGDFRFADVIGGIDAKLKRRHPHVFGDIQVKDADEVLRNWEAIKARERDGSGSVVPSRLASVPRILPALTRAHELGDRAARVGFDWPDAEGVLGKVLEETEELRVADSQDRAAELGDLLFSLVNLARWLGIDAESALRGTCDRFTERFAAMEQQAAVRGTDLADLSLSELDALWERAKASL